MSEENNEMIDLLKELVTRLKNLEDTVYDDSNILMKSGIVRVNGIRPRTSEHTAVPDSDVISKMSWGDINDLVSKLGGN